MNQSTSMGTEVAVMPLRFTEHLPQMRDFLALLGFSPRVSRAEAWLDMVGGSGMVALHALATAGSDAYSGQTDLSFEIADAEALATRFADTGLDDVVVYDEAYGRVLRVRDPGGTQLYFRRTVR